MFLVKLQAFTINGSDRACAAVCLWSFRPPMSVKDCVIKFVFSKVLSFS